MSIKLTQLHKQSFKDLQASQLVIDMSGKSVNSTLANTFRRLALNFVPTYAFAKESITIEENTSIFDNDFMRLRLSQLTVPNVDVQVNFLHDKYWREINYNDPQREKDQNDKELVEMYINITNNTKDVMNVTTNNAIVYQNGNEVQKFDKKYPILIVQLRPGQVFKCRAVGVLGVGRRNDIWAAAADAYYEEITSTDYKLTIESQGQLDEYEILIKSCDVADIKLNDLKHHILDQYSTDDIIKGNSLILKLEGEDHTIGNLINEFLQKNSEIVFSGFSKPDLLKEEIVINFRVAKSNPIKVLLEIVDMLIDLFADIKMQLESMSGKKISKSLEKKQQVKQKNK